MPQAATFETTPCRVCGATLRYASNRACVPCVRRKQATYRAESVSPERAAVERVAAAERARRYRERQKRLAAIDEDI